MQTQEAPGLKFYIPSVKNVILVSSCKGGVGKSTIAFYLALALSKKHKVGLIDADIYGPSVPVLTGISDKPDIQNNQMIPHVFKGMQTNSIGYLIPSNQALIWRGPMLTKALHQLLAGTKWSELDFLIVDMPPGTGDIHLTCAQKYNIKGVLLVTTPQSLAVSDLSRTCSMYTTLGLSVLGVIENMSYFLDDSGNKQYLFGKGEELQSFIAEYKLKTLAQIPLYQDVTKIEADLGRVCEFVV